MTPGDRSCDDSLFLRWPAFSAGDLRSARYYLTTWLDAYGWPEEGSTSLVRAVVEACAHALDRTCSSHSHGPVSVHAAIRSNACLRYAVVHVRDHATDGRHPARAAFAPDLRCPELQLVRGLVDDVQVRTERSGVCVVMTSAPAPLGHSGHGDQRARAGS